MPADEHLGTQFNSLKDVSAAGYNTHGWSRWQQGQCGTYACGLQKMRPGLGIGTLEDGGHFFAHDTKFAYDSAGRHPLPYTGIEGQAESVTLNTSAEEWGLPHEEAGPEGPGMHIAAAIRHARRHGILEGRYGRRA